MEIKENWEHRCRICEETITNPICDGCLNKEAARWMDDRGVELELMETETENGATSCLKCGRKMEVCMYCHVQELRDLVAISCPQFSRDFKETFRMLNYGQFR